MNEAEQFLPQPKKYGKRKQSSVRFLNRKRKRLTITNNKEYSIRKWFN